MTAQTRHGLGELLISRGGFVLRELAVRWAQEARKAIEAANSQGEMSSLPECPVDLVGVLRPLNMGRSVTVEI